MPRSEYLSQDCSRDFSLWLEDCNEGDISAHLYNAKALMKHTDKTVARIGPPTLQTFMYQHYIIKNAHLKIRAIHLLPRSLELFLIFLSSRGPVDHLRKLLAICRDSETYLNRLWTYIRSSDRDSRHEWAHELSDWIALEASRQNEFSDYPHLAFFQAYDMQVVQKDSPTNQQKAQRFFSIYSCFARSCQDEEAFHYSSWERFLSWWYAAKHPAGSLEELTETVFFAQQPWLEWLKRASPSTFHWPLAEDKQLQADMRRILAWKKYRNPELSVGGKMFHQGFFQVRTILENRVLLRDVALDEDFVGLLTGALRPALHPGDYLAASLRHNHIGHAVLQDPDVSALFPEQAKPYLNLNN